MVATMDSDGVTRWDVEWEIQGRKGTRSGKLHELHEQEVAGARHAIRLHARRGDTVNIRVT
ncbi:hypothetical protein Q0Z83_059960 [Actinoplanes sichuanensis]|uniref:Uncharacterized protein n=1 Tax=Actinoplanes sichuanensis TaxID=512349 RepID=A0ABW4A629_9ACTN|nr:hypothetical protein [Actinoplanes sichuanensis]BEL07805.1 hypothetical protein Q0Z83_059960 [Actinoplanes sichuanensis]